MRVAAAILALLLSGGLAFGQDRPEPTQRALAQMVREAMEREALALAEVYRLQATVEDLKARNASPEPEKPASGR